MTNENEEAIKRLKNILEEVTETDDSVCYVTVDDADALKVAIKALEQQPKTGHWIKTGDYYTGAYECLDYFECSCCHEESLEEGDYCPNCGAKMEVEE